MRVLFEGGSYMRKYGMFIVILAPLKPTLNYKPILKIDLKFIRQTDFEKRVKVQTKSYNGESIIYRRFNKNVSKSYFSKSANPN